jgi:hypothetical protein
VRIRFIHNTLVATAVAAAATLWPESAIAQHHGGPPHGGGRAVVVAAPMYFGYGYYDPFWWGYDGWWGYPGWVAPYGAAPVAYAPDGASVRLQVKPRNAEVYIDGYYVGNVDDFDGFLQRLDLPPGEHELTLYHDGYHTIREKVLFRPGVALNIKYEMKPLATGEPAEPRPETAPPNRASAAPPPEPPPTPPERPSSSSFGTLAIRVQPSDASVSIDGQEWTAPEGPGPMRIEVAAGEHEIEVKKDGYSTFQRTVRARAGETVSLNVSLSR